MDFVQTFCYLGINCPGFGNLEQVPISAGSDDGLMGSVTESEVDTEETLLVSIIYNWNCLSNNIEVARYT